MPIAPAWFRIACVGLGLVAGAPAARAGGNVNAVLESEVVFLDPYGTTANITRTFSFMVYDTLFSTDSAGVVHPQMVDRTTVSADKLTYSFTLRPGLKFHDGAKVTGEDVVASLKRWEPKDALGRMLAAATASMDASEDGFTIKLKEPFPLVLEVLGKPNSIVPFILPARLANIAADAKVTEIVGSGPFIFRPDQWKPGDSMVLERNPGYVPRGEKPDFLSGGKVVKIDRLTLKVIPDVSTAATALLNGEIDYLQYPAFEWLPKMQKDAKIKVMSLGGMDQYQGNFRLNHANPPFNDPAVRRVLWKLVDQTAMLQAAGIPPEFSVPNCASFWMCGTPLQSKAGTEVAGFNIEAAKEELKKTGYHGEKVVVMELGNSPIQLNVSLVLVDAMRKAGFTVDEQTMDWGSLLQRRVKKDSWGLFAVWSNGVDMDNPLTHFYVAANCSEFPGWSCEPALKPLVADFVKAETQADRKLVADKIQAMVYENTPSVMWGQFTEPSAYRTTLTGMIASSYPMFWEVDKTAK